MEKAVSASRKPNILMRALNKSSFWLSLWFERIAMVGIVGIIVATLIDVIGAKVFQKPLSGGTEVVYFLQVLAIAGALAFTQIENRHIRLEFVDAFPKTIRGLFHFFAAILGLALFIILAWKSFEYAQALNRTSEVTATSRIPLYPLAIWIALSCIPLCLVLLRDMANSIIEVIKK
jgi:TRAP-type C4-dicarboxylate transport system permease small subunit